MDYPKSVPNVGLVDGKFVDENTATGVVGSLIPSAWGNGVTDEILAVIIAAGITPDEANHSQLLAALKGRLIGVQVFTSSGTYKPTVGTKSVIVEMVGGGGSGGGSGATTSTTMAAASGGWGAGYAKGMFTTGFAGLAVTVGAGGAGSASGGNPGSASSLGSLISAPGGIGGGVCNALTPPFVLGAIPYSGSPAPTGANIAGGYGQPPGFGIALGTNTVAGTGANGNGGAGGSSLMGAGGHPPIGAGGRAGSGYGSGSSGSFSPISSGAQASVAGQPGIVIIWEYA